MKPKPTVAAKREPTPEPAWVKPTLLALAAILLLTWFTGEIGDTDFWLHLMTGRHTLEHRALTVPDPFSYTSSINSPAFPNESKTRYFNLTHEWLAQIVMYLIHSAFGFPGMVLARALLLMAFCGLVGLMVWWRTAGFYRSLAAVIAAGAVAINFQQSRPFLITFLFLAVTMAVMERRRYVWALPVVFLIWANCHGGYFLGWVMVGAYCLEALIRRVAWRDQRELWCVAAACFVASAINPNGLRVIEIMLRYRQSGIQSQNIEWQYPIFWEPSGYSFVLVGALLMLLIARRKTRPVDWILYFVFGAASLMAVRNTILMGLVGAVLMFAYLPVWNEVAKIARLVAVPVLLAFTWFNAHPFQLRAAEWMLPSGAADFLATHHVTGRMFNTYENGGYLVWRLWPAQKDFIDPRGLSEQAYLDYGHVLNNDPLAGQSRDEVLRKYGIDVMVMNGFDRFSGTVFNIAAALADPHQTEWKLVQADDKGVVFMRTPPAGVTPLNSLEALHSIELQCQSQVAHDPDHKACIQGVTALYNTIGDAGLAARWRAWAAGK
ncbi:MAG TPA: hypothetical protein VKE70_16715 [Candidatus Solibacter sp.]|nr:hypothetical protein [Candidatus Solibacter sp.]